MKASLRCLVVDDEEGARALLRKRLRAHPQLVIVGEAESVPEARRRCETLRPDVIFLDIRMPEADGFALIPHLNPRPQIVFVTAHADRAVEAFHVDAVDYLLKPYSEERMASTVARLLQRAGQATPPVRGPEPTPLRLDQSVVVRTETALLRVSVADIVMVEADGSYSRLTVGAGKQYLLNQTIAGWMDVLPASDFCRVDRFRIINLRKVEEVTYRREARDESEVHLAGLDQLTILRRLATSRLRAALRERTVR